MAWSLSQAPVAHQTLVAQRPDFLIISPPKTGSTWLADNLRCHPAIFIPAIKEIKYFSTWFKRLDLNWYLQHFILGSGRVKGEASPDYALLPIERIRLIRSMAPDLKLIFLMREPVSRAWSHARHNCRYREVNFVGSNSDFEDVTDEQWTKNFSHDWPMSSGDYFGQLRRWLTVFPREQLYVDFFESIEHDPIALLRKVFAFLGVDPALDLGGFPIRERILAGLPAELRPTLRCRLQQLLCGRSIDLASFLREQFNLTPPPAWRDTLVPSEIPQATPAVFLHDLDDAYIANVLAQEESFPSAQYIVLDDYRGHSIDFHRGLFYAINLSLGRIESWKITENEMSRYQSDGMCLVAPSLAEVKESLNQHLFERTIAQDAKLRSIQTDLLKIRQEYDCLRHEFRQVEDKIRKMETDTNWLRPWFFLVNRVFRPVGRWLRTVFGGKRSVDASANDKCKSQNPSA